MSNWFLRHGATLLILLGTSAMTLAGFIVDGRARGEREKRRVGFWPFVILFGGVFSVVGAFWAGYGQDRILEYLSGGESYGFLMPGTDNGKSLQFLFVAHGENPLYDVVGDLSDVTKYRKLWLEKGWPPEALDPNSGWQDTSGKINPPELLELSRSISTNFSIGNVAPNTIRPVLEASTPASDDQAYAASISARNGLITEQLLMHRTASGPVWAWHVERTSPQVKDGKQSREKLEEYAQPGFPADKLKWR